MGGLTATGGQPPLGGMGGAPSGGAPGGAGGEGGDSGGAPGGQGGEDNGGVAGEGGRGGEPSGAAGEGGEAGDGGEGGAPDAGAAGLGGGAGEAGQAGAAGVGDAGAGAAGAAGAGGGGGSAGAPTVVTVSFEGDAPLDCVEASCPAQAPYVVGCDLIFSQNAGPFPWACIETSTGSRLFFVESGISCQFSYLVEGSLTCSSEPPAAPLDGSTCLTQNRPVQYFVADRCDCPLAAQYIDGC